MSERPLFHTVDGYALPAVTSAEMREVDRIAADQTGPAVLQMLEHAGMNLARSGIELLGAAWRSADVIVLAGSGNNGAGGVCAARHLANRGISTRVVTITPPQRSDGALGQQFLAASQAPVAVSLWNEAFDIASYDLVIDAVIGYGLSVAPRAAQMALVRAAMAGTEAGVPVLSLDVPSGIDADTGEAPGFAVRPDRTLTVALPKQGLTRENAGDLWVADIGIPAGVYARAGLVVTPFFGPATAVRLRYPGEAPD